MYERILVHIVKIFRNFPLIYFLEAMKIQVFTSFSTNKKIATNESDIV